VTDALRVALTFDAEHPDRPHHGEHAAWVLDELARLDVRATFFVQGRWAEAFPALARRMAEEGHLVGSHTFYHARVPLLTAEGFDEDVRETERVLLEVTGVDPRPWFRLPFGAGADDEAVVRRIVDMGYRHVGWDVELYEWDPGRSADEIAERAVQGVELRGDGAIILCHTWPDPVAPALSAIIARLRDRGSDFVGVDELDLPEGLASVGQPQPASAPAG